MVASEIRVLGYVDGRVVLGKAISLHVPGSCCCVQFQTPHLRNRNKQEPASEEHMRSGEAVLGLRPCKRKLAIASNIVMRRKRDAVETCPYLWLRV